MPDQPFFSIVIPTRNRARTLRFALETCAAQDFDDYEIVVCDNSDGDETARLLRDHPVPKLRTVRPAHVLAMSDNWELAVSQARGQYIHVLGDDDGLLPFALRELHRLIDETHERAIRWSSGFYAWPCVAVSADANYLRLPMNRTRQQVRFREFADRVIHFEQCYTTLPSVYNSVVHRNVLDELIRRSGRIFHCRYPDVYTGFAVGAVVDRFLSLEVPMSISGVSGKSNGINSLFVRKPNETLTDFNTLNNRTNIPHHPTVPDLPVFPYVQVADAFQQAHDRLFSVDWGLALDRKQIVDFYVQGLWADHPEHWKTQLELIRASLADRPDLVAWFDEVHQTAAYRPASPMRLHDGKFGFEPPFHHIRTEPFGIKTIADAVQWADRLLGIGSDPIRWSEPTDDQVRIKQLEGEVAVYRESAEERLALIDRLHRHANELRRQLEDRSTTRDEKAA